MKIAEMKQILVDKFKAENCSFKKQDINIKAVNDNKYNIYIKDYQHIIFTMFTEEPDEYFGYTVIINNNFEDCDIFVESKNGYDFESALIELGYFIATRF